MPATYEPISTTTLGTAAASITFSSIPATYTDLRLTLVNPLGAASYYLYFRLNSDSAANYSRTILYGTGGSALSSTSTADNFALLGYLTTTQPTFQTLDIFSYAGSTNKTWLITSSQDANGSGEVRAQVGLWRSTSAITTLAISRQTGNLDIGTTATLYGIKAA